MYIIGAEQLHKNTQWDFIAKNLQREIYEVYFSRLWPSGIIDHVQKLQYIYSRKVSPLLFEDNFRSGIKQEMLWVQKMAEESRKGSKINSKLRKLSIFDIQAVFWIWIVGAAIGIMGFAFELVKHCWSFCQKEAGQRKMAKKKCVEKSIIPT